jgi:hypothetical protein
VLLQRITESIIMKMYNRGVLLEKAMVDTEIWSIAKKRPLPDNFSSKEK